MRRHADTARREIGGESPRCLSGMVHPGRAFPRIIHFSDFILHCSSFILPPSSFLFHPSALILFFAAFVVCAGPAWPEALFEYPPTYAVGTAPGPVAAADVNGDGKTDIIVGNQSSKNVSVLLNQGNGSFAAAKNSSAGKSFGPITAADIDGDKNVDLLFPSDGACMMWGRGDGTFPSPTTAASTTDVRATTAVDLNGDGKLDIIVACGNLYEGGAYDLLYSGVLVYLNNSGRMFFSPVGYASVSHSSSSGIVPRAVAAEDLNGDGYPDIVLCHDNDTQLYIFAGKASGTFNPVITRQTNLAGIQSICLADVDGNGKKDIILTSAIETTPVGEGYSVSVMLNGGGLNFATPVQYRAGYQVNWAATADLNGDAKPDIVTANPGSWDVSVLFNKGNGTFADAVDYLTGAQPASGNSPGAVALADFNGDGRMDIAATNSAENNVAVLLNQGKGNFPGPRNLLMEDSPDQIVSADFDGDGALDLAVASHATSKIYLYRNNGKASFTPAGSLAVNGFPAPALALCTGDFNGDNRPDVVVATEGAYATFELFFNATGWGFAPGVSIVTSIVPEARSRAIAAGDLSGDGKLDLVITNTWTDTVPPYYIYSYLMFAKGNGDGTFQLTIDYLAGVNPDSVILFDINKDGKNDVAVANGSMITRRLNQGGGVLGTYLDMTGGTNGPFSLAAGDIDKDGDLDIVAATGNITVLLNRGMSQGDFALPPKYYNAGTTQFATLGDVDRDGYPDLLATVETGSAAVLRNNKLGVFGAPTHFKTGPKPVCICPGDFDRDGRLDLAVSNSLALTVTILRHPMPPASARNWELYTSGRQREDSSALR